jgi:hypothetical protein
LLYHNFIVTNQGDKTMALVPQKLYVIRDTQENIIMSGAKGQFAFDNSGSARRSLVHTRWWPQSKRDSTIRKLMPNGNSLVDALEQMDKELKDQGWHNRDGRLVQARNDARQEIRMWEGQSKEYESEYNKIKFDNQTRFVIEYLVSIETKEI